jgi:hypothetical protein
MPEINEDDRTPFQASVTFGQGQEQGLAIIRQLGVTVYVALSLKNNGDAQALLDLDSARKLSEALRAAVDRASKQ